MENSNFKFIGKPIPFFNLIISIIVFLISFISFYISFDDFNILFPFQIPQINEKLILPTKFILNFSLRFPITNQGSRGTCWLFQIIELLESSYKLNGYKLGFLLKNEYIKFSKESLGVLMVQKCLKFPNSNPCIKSMRIKNTTQGGSTEELIDFIKEWPEFSKFILPESCCEYQDLPENEMICLNLNNYLLNNPIEFSIKNIFSSYNILKIKEYLIKNHLPLGISLTLPVQRYYFDCNNIKFKNFSSCKQFELPCPNNISKYCTFLDYKLYKMTNIDFIYQFAGQFIPGSPHALILIGYNDNFIPKRSISYSNSTFLKGGFILKNSWGNKGHSFEYLMNEISEEEEEKLCPNIDDVSKWIPATFQCINETKNHLKCSNDLFINRGNKIINYSDELICINSTHCNLNDTYILLRKNDYSNEVDIEWSSEGVPLPKLIKLNSNSIPEIVTFNTIPIQHLYYALKLKEIDINNLKCGYIFLGYDIINELLKRRIGPSRSFFSTIGLDIEWKNYSYYKNSIKKYNYEMLKKSIHYL